MAELHLTGTWEQALLTALIREAQEMKADGGAGVGRTVLQKLLYFLKRRGVPMSYRFNMHHFGPFCSEILRDAEWLQADEVLADTSSEPARYSSYTTGPAVDSLLSLHGGEIQEHLPVVRDVISRLSPLRPERLELMATLHYIHRSEAATGKSGCLKDAVINRFMAIKGDRFQRPTVEEAFGALMSAGLIAS